MASMKNRKVENLLLFIPTFEKQSVDFFYKFAIKRLVKMAAASTNSIRKIALAIDNEEYTDGPVLPNAIKDSKDVAAALKRIGFINHEPKLNLNYRDRRVCFTDFECLIEKK